MELSAFEYKLLPKLASLASTVTLEGSYDLELLEKGSRSFTLPKGIAYQLQLTNTGGAVLLSGSARAEVSSECDRCLAPASFEVEGEVQEYFLFHAAAGERDSAEAEFTLLNEEGTIDLAPFICAAIVYELPLIVLCRKDCAGLCSVCGADLNHQSCSCGLDAVSEDHPFAALKQLL